MEPETFETIPTHTHTVTCQAETNSIPTGQEFNLRKKKNGNAIEVVSHMPMQIPVNVPLFRFSDRHLVNSLNTSLINANPHRHERPAQLPETSNRLFN